MIKGSVNKIETFGLVDGPGIRTVVFLNGCKLRCIYCHNPEMWNMKEFNYTPLELAKKIINNKPYFSNNGGVTFSGGEPLLQKEFITLVCKILKKEQIHIALDTSGVGYGNYKEILSYVDLVILDIKHTKDNKFQDLTKNSIDKQKEFIKELNESEKPVWIRQVILEGMMDNDTYLDSLKEYLKGIKNIERIEFLPYHSMAKEKYEKLNIEYPLKDMKSMDKTYCDNLYDKFIDKLKKDV